MNPKDLCYCRDEREWHDACSKCWCPFFLPPDAPPAVVRGWKREMKVRKIRETGR